MVQLVKNWIRDYLGDPEIAVFWIFLLLVIAAFAFFSKMLAPVLVSVAIAYLLQWPIVRLERIKIPHKLSVIIVYLLFISVMVIAAIWLVPLLVKQLSNLVNELPNTIGKGQAFLQQLPDRYPSYITADQILRLTAELKTQLTSVGQIILSASLASIPSVIAAVIYLILVPMLVYFFLMDQQTILNWFGHYLPRNKRLITKVWAEVYQQIGNYVRGKVLEMVIVWIVCYAVFGFMGLQYAFLLSALVGISVVIPYIGAVLVTIPVLVIAFLQWGWGQEFAILLGAYAVIIAVDANVLVPLLFSEAVDLHPVAIIIAVLVFGGLLGFWGVFFAIPLATLVKAIINVSFRQGR